MKQTLVLLAVVALFVGSGCTKKPASNVVTETNAAPASGDQKPVAVPPPLPHVAANAQNVPAKTAEGEVHPFLTQQLQLFVNQKGRLPQSFAELVSARLDSVPRAPEGKKWVIDASAMQVKAVKAQ
jgi:hypothetical protein